MSAIILPPTPPHNPVNIFKIIGKVAKAIKAFLTPPKQNESPEDVIERQKAFQFFCDRVHQEASQVEQYVVQQLENYGSYLNMLSSLESYDILKKYHVNTRSLLAQLEILKMQIPGIIRTEVSSRLSDNDAECMRIRRMLPGAEKEAQMNHYLESIISAAVDKCAQTTESIMIQMQNTFIDDLQECLDTSRQQLESIERGLSVFTSTADEAVERAKAQAKAEHIIRYSELIYKLFD